MPFSGKVSVRIAREKNNEQAERKAEEGFHLVETPAYRIQILGVNGLGRIITRQDATTHVLEESFAGSQCGIAAGTQY